MSQVQVTLPIEPDDDGWPHLLHERVWAELLPDGLARVDNIPFFSSCAALGDVVSFTTGENQPNDFERVVRPSENSLVRVMCQSREVFDSVARELEAFGCSVEAHLQMFLLAVSIPPTVDIQLPMDYLVEKEATGCLEYQEAIIRLAP